MIAYNHVHQRLAKIDQYFLRNQLIVLSMGESISEALFKFHVHSPLVHLGQCNCSLSFLYLFCVQSAEEMLCKGGKLFIFMWLYFLETFP